MFLLLSVALAQSYSADLKVPNAVPQNAPSDALILAGFTLFGVADGYADVDVASDWAYLSCHIDAGDVLVIFKATPSDFPSSFPSTATCSYGGATLSLSIQPVLWPKWGPQLTNPAQGLHYDMAPPPNRPDLFGRMQLLDSQPLPVGPPYVAGEWPAKLSPTLDWPHVSCGVFYNDAGKPRLKVHILQAAEEDEGFCVLTSASGVPHAIPISFNR